MTNELKTAIDELDEIAKKEKNKSQDRYLHPADNEAEHRLEQEQSKPGLGGRGGPGAVGGQR